jgi:hypothetical protein
MSTLPLDASNAPQPADNEPDDSTAVPSWAVPAVPPPWTGTGQAAPGASALAAQEPIEPAPVEPASVEPAQVEPASVATAPVEPVQAPAPAGPPAWAQPAAAPQQFGQPAYGQPAAAPVVARKPLFDRQKWLPTVAVAGIVAVVVLGGLGLDKVIAAPSAGTVDIGQSVTIKAAPGWVKTETSGSGSGGGAELQKSDAILTATAVAYGGQPPAALAEVEAALQQDVSGQNSAQISFGTEHDGTLGGYDAAMVSFSAIVSGPSGSGTIDGEVICLVTGGKAIVFEVYAPQGDLDPVADDILTMVNSVEVG